MTTEPAKKAHASEKMSTGCQSASNEAGNASNEAVVSLVNANIGNDNNNALGSQDVNSVVECVGAKEDEPLTPHIKQGREEAKTGPVEANEAISLVALVDLFDDKKNSKQFHNIFNLKNSVQPNKMGI